MGMCAMPVGVRDLTQACCGSTWTPITIEVADEMAHYRPYVERESFI